ncbi:hypothetical protein ZHAS_00021909 [Anopheles sinensis]|uniref:Uncharacterized protein n=1 Tax=Anopheles sinensis TaxID=74873 RepID=A0A084WTW8_ANOSI|nr:hypothetical protein ZHAS_00021909 [Anopheles sinensis]
MAKAIANQAIESTSNCYVVSPCTARSAVTLSPSSDAHDRADPAVRNLMAASKVRFLRYFYYMLFFFAPFLPAQPEESPELGDRPQTPRTSSGKLQQKEIHFIEIIYHYQTINDLISLHPYGTDAVWWRGRLTGLRKTRARNESCPVSLNSLRTLPVSCGVSGVRLDVGKHCHCRSPLDEICPRGHTLHNDGSPPSWYPRGAREHMPRIAPTPTPRRGAVLMREAQGLHGAVGLHHHCTKDGKSLGRLLDTQ